MDKDARTFELCTKTPTDFSGRRKQHKRRLLRRLQRSATEHDPLRDPKPSFERSWRSPTLEETIFPRAWRVIPDQTLDTDHPLPFALM